MSSLNPITALQTAPLVRAATLHVEAPRSEDRGPWAYTQRGAARHELPPHQTILPPEQGGQSGRDYRQARPQYDRDFRPSSAFFAQYLSQEALPDDTPPVGAAAGAAKYPSLGFDSEIFLPGEAIPTSSGPTRRLDITV